MPLVFTSTSIGKRPYQEDTFCNAELTPDTYFMGIFDGHGGGAVSKMCEANFVQVIKQGIQDTPYDIGTTIHNSFYIVDNLAYHMNVPYVGSTVVFCIVQKDQIWFANAGDSMIMVGFKDGSCALMSQEHKVELERDRIIREGGFITNFDGCARINGNLNVSRAIGDHHLKRWVNCNPYVRSLSSKSKLQVKYIFLASDGIWDVINHNGINKIVTEHMSVTGDKNIKEMLQAITNTAQQLGSTDNITCTYCDLE